MYLEIISPEGQIFSGDITAVTVPGAKGQFQVLKSHAPIVSVLESGVVRVYNDKGFKEAKISDKMPFSDGNEFLVDVCSGVIKSQQDSIIILVD